MLVDEIKSQKVEFHDKFDTIDQKQISKFETRQKIESAQKQRVGKFKKYKTVTLHSELLKLVE